MNAAAPRYREPNPVAYRPASSPLDTRAQALYDAEAGWREFAVEFTRVELEELAELCMLTPARPYGRAYDDEVFDALAMKED